MASSKIPPTLPPDYAFSYNPGTGIYSKNSNSAYITTSPYSSYQLPSSFEDTITSEYKIRENNGMFNSSLFIYDITHNKEKDYYEARDKDGDLVAVMTNPSPHNAMVVVMNRQGGIESFMSFDAKSSYMVRLTVNREDFCRVSIASEQYSALINNDGTAIMYYGHGLNETNVFSSTNFSKRVEDAVDRGEDVFERYTITYNDFVNSLRNSTLAEFTYAIKVDTITSFF